MSSSSAFRPSGPAAAGTVFHAVVPAAGRGERFGGEIPKQFLTIAGRPLLSWTLARLFAAGAASVSVALPEEELASIADLFGSDARIRAVAGGSTRQASVAAALEASPAASDELVAVHDGARAAVDPTDVRRTVEAAVAAGGAVLGRAATDTVKRLDGDRIAATLDRRGLFFAETPQVFRRSLLERALAAARDDRFLGTDEASLVERLEGVTRASIVAIEAAQPNPKVTFRSDLEAIARILVGGGRP